MPRKSRSAPDLEDPLEAYSTWDIRIAKVIYYGFILATAILVLGIWGLILDWVIRTGKWDFFVDLDLGYQIAIISGAVTGHLFLLVLFYILFRGGMVRFCRVLFKDRLLAKKWEDYYGLRMLVGVALLGLYITLVSLAVGLLPTVFFDTIGDLWLWMVDKFGPGEWILWVGAMILLLVSFIFLGLMIWNHGVFWVLKHVKEIEEEIEIEEQIKKDAIKNADERTLRDIYKKETGQKPIYRGKETRGYKEWKEKLKV
jgi:hypothetical protein